MATVAELVDFVTRAASLNTSNDTEQQLVRNFLNDAYQRAVGRTGVTTYAGTSMPSAGATVIARSTYAPANSTVNTVNYVYMGSGSSMGRELRRASLHDLAEMRNNTQISTDDGPVMYHARTNGDIELWPSTTGVNSFTIEVELAPPTLVTAGAVAGQETTPSVIPPMFHYDVLANYAISKALEYRGLEARASQFRQLAENGIREMREWINEQGGIMGPTVKLIRPNGSTTGLMADARW